MDYVVLPLYSTRYADRPNRVPERSGLNQWNAGGRRRHPDEAYVPVPQAVNDKYPGFFPAGPFTLVLPDGTVLSASICQENEKALMSSPNSALGHWLLRDLLRIPAGQLATEAHLTAAGFDSVIVTRITPSRYSIAPSPTLPYADFIRR